MRRKLLCIALLLTLLTLVKVEAQIAPPNAGFAYDYGIDTVWINSPYIFVNTSTNDNFNYWDVTEITGGFDVPPTRQDVLGYGSFIAVQTSPTRNFRYTFTQTGTYTVKLVVRNNLGADSISKTIYVGIPTQKPIANFFIDKQVMGGGEQIELFDLSQNGPTEWYWYMNPRCYSCGPFDDNNTFVPNEYTQLPRFWAREGGNYGVCLVVKNSVGVDTLCRNNYVDVIAGRAINTHPGDTITTLYEGYLFDNGGPATYDYSAPYITSIFGSAQLENAFFQIAPCASIIDLYVESFRFRPQDTLIIRELSKTGPIITKLAGPTILPSQRKITAYSGKMVLEWKVQPTPTGVQDSGFVFKYTSVPATYSPPQASFTCPDIVYSGYNVQYINHSTGQGNLTYQWDADGADSDNDPNNDTGMEFETKDANWTFTNTVGMVNRNICLWVSNCMGTSRFCKVITVMPIVTPPVANFTSPRTAGFTTDKFQLIDSSSNGVLNWEWTISPNTVTFINGTTKNSQNPVLSLNGRGRYSVKLKVGNALGVDSIEKVFFFDVISYSSPNTEWPIASGNDIGISRVTYADVDTTTSLKTPIYDTLFTQKTAVLYRGVNYPIQVFRNTSESPMDRKIWIDTSLDGLFLAPGELIYSEINQKTLTATANFQLPNDLEPGRVLRMRIGISEGNSTLTPDKATSGCFEDYGILIGDDDVVPSIELLGDTLLRVELNKSFNNVDPGVLAIDNHEGDISHKHEAITNLDVTKVGYYYKKYFVKDLYGNVSDTVSRTIQVEVNTTGPKLSLNAPDSIFFRVRKDTLALKKAVPSAVAHSGFPMDSKLIREYGSVDTSIIGDYVIKWAVNDDFGFTDTVTQRIYVRDIEAPTIRTFYPDNLIKHQIGTAFDDRRGLIIDDNYYSIDQLTLTRTGSVNENIPNSYSVQYTLCDPSGNCAAPFYAQVEVRDTVAPTAWLLGPNPWVLDVYTTNTQIKTLDAGVFYSDNYYPPDALIYTENYTNINPNKLGVYHISYSVRDAAGNETTLTRQVNIVDREAPRIELLGPSTIDLPWNEEYIDFGVKLTDNYDSDAQLRAALDTTTTLDVVEDPIIGNKWYGKSRGWKEVKYNLKDASGNVAREMKRTIYVDFRSGLTNNIKASGELNVYPNPNNGIFTLSTKEPLKGSISMTIYNILGAKVHSETFDSNGQNAYEIKTSQLNSGVYLLHVTNNGKQYSQRITIK